MIRFVFVFTPSVPLVVRRSLRTTSVAIVVFLGLRCGIFGR
jgi:hypothetical protein